MQHSAVQLSGTVTDIAGILGNERGAALPAQKKKKVYLKCIIKATINAKYPENLSKKNVQSTQALKMSYVKSGSGDTFL